MALYLTRFSYTPETWARLAQKPEDRRDAARTYIEAVGGKLHGFWYAFGEYDAYNLWEVPDNVSMAAVAVAISGGGALSKLETTVGSSTTPGRRTKVRPVSPRMSTAGPAVSAVSTFTTPHPLVREHEPPARPLRLRGVFHQRRRGED